MNPNIEHYTFNRNVIIINLGVYIVKGKEDALASRNMVTGESVYGEKRVSVQTDPAVAASSIEYRVWNPFRSKVSLLKLTKKILVRLLKLLFSWLRE